MHNEDIKKKIGRVMFYKTEILGIQNRTELAILYYCSTVKTRTLVRDKDVYSFDITKSLEILFSPPEPFALHLSIHLMKGVVMIWNIKKQKCKKMLTRYEGNINKIVKVSSDKITRKKISINNIRIDEFTNTVEENINTFSLLEGISEIQENGNRPLASKDTFMKIYRENLELPREEGIGVAQTDNFLSINEHHYAYDSSEKSLEILKKPQKIKTDKRISIGSERHRILKMTTRNNQVFEFPVLIGGEVLELFDNAVAEITRNKIKNTTGCSSNNTENSQQSLEFTRNNLSFEAVLSVEDFHENSLEEVDEQKSKALWFYDILVQASQGKISPTQEHPFGQIKY